MSRRGILAAFCAFGAFWGGWAVLVPTVQETVGASTGQLGLALLGIGLGSLPAMLLAGQLIDRTRLRVLPLAFAVFALAALLPGLVHSVWALGGVLLVLGACTGAADVAVNAATAAHERRHAARLMQLAHGFFSIGVIVGAVVAGVMRQEGTGTLTVLAVLAAVLLAAALANRGPAVPHEPGNSLLQGGNGNRRALVVLGAACAIGFLIESGMENWSALFLERELHAAAAASAAGPASYAAAMALGRLLGHRLALGDRTLLTAGATLALVGLLAGSVAPNVPVAAVAFFVAGLGVSTTAPTLFGAGGVFGARGVATVTTLGYLGFVVAPPAVGGIASAIGLRGAFAALAGCAALLALAAPRLPLRR